MQKIRTRFTILLYLLIFGCLAAFIVFRNIEKKTLLLLFAQESNDEMEMFDKIVILKEKSLETLAYDYTYWDEMVNFIDRADKSWAEKMLNSGTLSNYGVNAIWVYRLDTSLVYLVNNLLDKRLQDLPMPKEAFVSLFKTHFAHFFLKTAAGPLEIRGATVHPSADEQRKTSPHGYFFTARLWDNKYIADLAGLTGSQIEISGVKENKMVRGTLDPKNGTITFTRTLNGWDGYPLLQLNVKAISKPIKSFNIIFKKFFVIFLLFAISVIVIFTTSFMKWVSTPLSLIATTLKTGEFSNIRNLQSDKAEFGDITRLIKIFFKQKEELSKEIVARKETELQLLESYQKLKEAQEQVIQSSKMAAVGQLAAGISHELNQPLTGIKGFAQDMLMELDRESSMRQDLEKIVTQADRIDKIIQNVRIFARRADFKLEELDINKPVEDAIMLISEQLKLHGIYIEKALTENLPKIEGDSNQLQQVILNLITNARDAIYNAKDREDKKIIITTALSDDGNLIEITCQDTGCGIPPQSLESIFNPFFTTKSPKGGIGLGLSIAYGIIKEHKGSIEVKSQLSKGTTFYVRLPFKK